MSFFGNLSTLFGNASQPAKSPAHKPNKPAPPTSKQPPKPVAKQPSKPQPSPQPQPQVKQPLSAPKTTPAATTPQLQNQADAFLRDAQSKAREIIVEAKDAALATKIKADKESQAILRQVEQQQRDLTIKIDRIDQKLSQIDDKEKAMDQEKERLKSLRAQIETTKEEALTKLEKAASLTAAEAKQQLIEQVQKSSVHELAQIIAQKEEDARAQADIKAKEVLIQAMQYAATDYVAEYTSSVITLGSEDLKGKIIGKAGRNIHSFERVTGVDVDLDVGPTEVKLSCFDPVRREVARIALEKLMKDGRIQPARIEEIVIKTKKEINKITFDEGRNLCHSIGIYNLPNELMQIIGRYKYRSSYGQNMIAHVLEVTRAGVKIAHELGLNVNVVKLGCLLHDIGKVSEEVEGSHVELGIKIAKKFNIPEAVISCIAQHHEDEPFSSFESMAVQIADAISGARPGARYENYEEYVQRLTKLEEIANAYPEVQKSYAIQAGREIRVILEPAKSKDDDVVVLAERIRDEVKQQITYPGTITVTVIREERGQAVAN
ncbi:ribonuclease Y [Microgenomates group bacterium]|nr:ribonuclease Y [Microgenomates group bacterium]